MDGRGIVYGYGEKRVEGSRFVEGEGALRACVREVRGLIWGGEAEEYSESFAGVGFLNRFSIGFWFWMLAVNVVCRLAVAGLVGFFPEKQCSVFLGVQYGCRQVSLPTWFRLLRMLAHGGWSRVAVGMLLATVYGRWERRFRGEGRVESAAVVAVSMVPVAVVAGHAGADVVTPVALVAGFDAVARGGKATRGVAWAAVAMGCAWALCPCRGLLPAVAVSVVALRRWRTRRPWKVPEVEKSPSELGAIAPGVQWSGEALKEVQRMVETTTVDPGWPAVRVKAQMGDRLLGFMVAQVVEDEKGVPADVSRVERELLSNASMTRYMHIACPEWWARTGVSMHGDAAATVYEAVWGCASGWFFSLPSTVQLKVARRVMKRLSETSGVEVSLPPDS